MKCWCGSEPSFSAFFNIHRLFVVGSNLVFPVVLFEVKHLWSQWWSCLWPSYLAALQSHTLLLFVLSPWQTHLLFHQAAAFGYEKCVSYDKFFWGRKCSSNLFSSVLTSSPSSSLYWNVLYILMASGPATCSSVLTCTFFPLFPSPLAIL